MSFLLNPYIYAGGCSGNVISLTSLGAYYKFENNANDSSGNGLNGTPQSSPTYGSGKFGEVIFMTQKV